MIDKNLIGIVCKLHCAQIGLEFSIGNRAAVYDQETEKRLAG